MSTTFRGANAFSARTGVAETWLGNAFRVPGYGPLHNRRWELMGQNPRSRGWQEEKTPAGPGQFAGQMTGKRHEPAAVERVGDDDVEVGERLTEQAGQDHREPSRGWLWRRHPAAHVGEARYHLLR